MRGSMVAQMIHDDLKELMPEEKENYIKYKARKFENMIKKYKERVRWNGE